MKLHIVIGLILLSVTGQSQIIGFDRPIKWIDDEKYPNTAFQELEAKKFQYIKPTNNILGDYINYALTNDIEGYNIRFSTGESSVSNVGQDGFLLVSRSITFDFLKSSQKEFDTLFRKIKTLCKYKKKEDQKWNGVPFTTFLYSHNSGVEIIVVDGILGDKGMMYSITFFRR